MTGLINCASPLTMRSGSRHEPIFRDAVVDLSLLCAEIVTLCSKPLHLRECLLNKVGNFGRQAAEQHPPLEGFSPTHRAYRWDLVVIPSVL